MDSRGEEKLDEWMVCVKEHLKLFEIDFVDTLSTENGKN